MNYIFDMIVVVRFIWMLINCSIVRYGGLWFCEIVKKCVCLSKDICIW